MADPFCNTAVGDDFHVAVGEQQINQHAVVVLRIPHPQQGKNIDGALPRGDPMPQRRRRQSALDDNSNLSRMALFRTFDRGFYGGQRRGRKNSVHLPVSHEEMTKKSA